MSYLAFPFAIDDRGRAAESNLDAHIRSLIALVLFTRPGERINRPDFGCGVQQLVFQPGSAVLATTTQFLVHGALDRWLGDLIEVESVRIEAQEERLHVDVRYRRRDTKDPRHDRFAAPTVAT